MKKTYNKLDSELLLVETEGGFMGASVRLEESVTVNPYKNYDGWSEGTFKTLDDGTKSFDISFE